MYLVRIAKIARLFQCTYVVRTINSLASYDCSSPRFLLCVSDFSEEINLQGRIESLHTYVRTEYTRTAAAVLVDLGRNKGQSSKVDYFTRGIKTFETNVIRS